MRWSKRILPMAFVMAVAMLSWKFRKTGTHRNEDAAATRLSSTPQQSPRYQALATWTAIFASLAAVGGLVFTAFSVRYQAEQTGLQAAAAGAQQDQQNKQQAQLVNIWPASDFSPGQMIVTVSNRSEEPIYQFRLYVAFATSDSGGYLAFSTWTSFPPCTQVNFDLQAIAKAYAETARFISPNHLSRFDYGIEFKDATGLSWHRHASGTLHSTPWLEYLSGADKYSPLLPPVFKSFTALAADQFTVPEPDSKFISSRPEAANGCS